jgi:hypothetical protein
MTAAQNSKFKNIDRAPYEIGHLLQALPPSFSIYKEQTDDVHEIADAIERHAYNTKGTVLSGLEAIGTVLFSAGTNDNCDIDQQSIANLGCLVRHLSVELQYLIEIEEECLGLKEKRRQLPQKKGGK